LAGGDLTEMGSYLQFLYPSLTVIRSGLPIF